MKIDGDGFKTIESDDKFIPDVVYAIVDNLNLLHEQIKELKNDLDQREGRKT